MLYICTKFHKNISNGSRVIKLDTISKENYKGQISVKNVDGVKVLVLCILSNDALYLYQVS